MPMFIQAMRNTGNVRASCQAAGISRQTAYAERRKNARFREEWDEALQDAIDLLEATAWKMARDGNPYLVWKMLQSLRQNVYGDKKTIDVTMRHEDRIQKLMVNAQCTREEAEAAIAEAEAIIAERSK